MVFLGLAGVSLAVTNLPPHDLWWQLRSGQIIATEHRIPTLDPFSFTARGEPWVVQEWLSGLIFYLLYHSFGWDSLVYLKFALMAAALVGLSLAGRNRGAPLLYSTAIGVFALYALRPWITIRPQLFTYALFSLFLALVERARKTKEPVYPILLIPLTVLWSNLHAGALLAPFILAFEMAGSILDDLRTWVSHRRNGETYASDRNWTAWLVGITLGTAGATLFNPHGWVLWKYPGQVTGHPIVTDFITEWKSPDFHSSGLYPFATFSLILLAVLILQGARPPSRDYLLLGVMLCTAMTFKRNIPLLVISSTPILIGRSWSLIGKWEWQNRIRWDWVGVVACLLSAVQLAGTLRMWPRGSLFNSEAGLYDFPVGAVEYMKYNPPPGPLFHDYRWGGYLIWNLQNIPVFIDGRAEVYYKRGVFDDYVTVHQLQPGWRAVLEKYKIQAVLVNSWSPIAQVLLTDPGWKVEYENQQTVLFVKQKG